MNITKLLNRPNDQLNQMSARTKGGELIPTGYQKMHCVTSEYVTVVDYTQIYLWCGCKLDCTPIRAPTYSISCRVKRSYENKVIQFPLVATNYVVTGTKLKFLLDLSLLKQIKSFYKAT